jgi:succinate dehydrogenase / fumarate reductase flavoprotein subunit
MDPHWRGRNLICSADGDAIVVREQPMPPMRGDLLALFDTGELAKYLTPDELAAVPAPATPIDGSES